MRHFVDDDPGYLNWIATHPEGYVLNTTRSPSSGYLMLHRTSCWTISRLQRKATTFTGEYSKLCGNRDEIEDRVRSFKATTPECGHCMRPR
jgi:hypothetical protein